MQKGRFQKIEYQINYCQNPTTTSTRLNLTPAEAGFHIEWFWTTTPTTPSNSLCVVLLLLIYSQINLNLPQRYKMIVYENTKENYKDNIKDDNKNNIHFNIEDTNKVVLCSYKLHQARFLSM